MINFIICEDEKILRDENIKQVTNIMMKYDIDYNIYEFDGYNLDFYNIVEKEIGFKIYLLDIVTNEGSGIDAARKIRELYDDWVSIIIMITSHEEYKYEVLSSRLYILDFINKLNNYDNKIRDDLEIAIKNYDKKYKMLSYEYNHIYYNIELRQIVYIEKEQDSKRCIIKTKNDTRYIPGTLNGVLLMLDDRFIKVHKSLIVNKNEIDNFDVKNNKITFKNGDITYLISRNYKKELIKSVIEHC